MKKILVTGCRGQLGRALHDYYVDSAEFKLIETDVAELDITNLKCVLNMVEEIKPDIIINCGAYTAVDKCETDKETAYKINVTGPENLSIASKRTDAVIVHISTDYVFDGHADKPYTEADHANPETVYGFTKYEGEQKIQTYTDKFFIVRTAWLYGEGKNFVRTMLELSQTRQEVTVVNDQYGTPTSAKEVVKVIDLLIHTESYGIYHATCRGFCTWDELAREIFGIAHIPITVVPVTTKEYVSVAKRPQYSVLANARLEKEFHYRMKDWHEALKEYMLSLSKEEKEKYRITMTGKKVLVTGANGYIGRHVVTALLEMGHEVLASDFAFDGVDARAKRVEVPIFSGDENIYALVGKPDVCIHLAWRNGFVHNADTHIMDLPNHVTFIKNMIEGGLASLAVMGTMHEVGYWQGAIYEDTPTNPSSFYGIAKNTLRQVTELLAKEKDVVIHWLRAYYILGDDLKNNSIFSRIAKLEKEGAETFPFNSGKNKYDFISVDELAKQIAAASVQTKINGVINCCTGKAVALSDKVEEFIKKNNYKIVPEYGAFPDRPYDSPEVWGDAAAIKEIMKAID